MHVSWLLNTRKDVIENVFFAYFLACKGLVLLSNDDVGVARGTVFQNMRPGAGFKTGNFVK